MPLIGHVTKPLAESVLIALGLTTGASETDAATQKNIYQSGATTLIFSNEEMEDIMKIHKSLEESGLLIKGVSEIIKNKAKEQEWVFLGKLLDTLEASLLGNLVTGKGTVRTGEGTTRARENF